MPLEFCMVTTELDQVLNPTLVKKKFLEVLSTYIRPLPAVLPADTVIRKAAKGA